MSNANSTPRLRYSLDFYNNPRTNDGRGFDRVSVTDDNGHDTEIITDGTGSGWFYMQDGAMRQRKGTCDFSLPRSKSACRALLRQAWTEEHWSEGYNCFNDELEDVRGW